MMDVRARPSVLRDFTEALAAGVKGSSVLGALIVKTAAYSVPSGSAKERHLMDFATLAAIARGFDRIPEQLTSRDRHYLAPVLIALNNSRRLWASIEGAERGVLALATAMAVVPQPAVIVPMTPPAPPATPSLDL